VDTMIPILEAAKRAGVSDKTLRRAIEAGKLVGHQRDTGKKQNNQPIFIAEKDLERYIAGRQVSTVTPKSTVQPEGTGLSSRLDELEGRVENVTQWLREAQETIAREQQEREALRRRVTELERALQDTQDLVVKSLTRKLEETGVPTGNVATSGHVETKETRQATKQDAPTFTIADFSKGWQSEYTCTATLADVKALWTLRPYVSTSPLGGNRYSVSYCDWDRVQPKGRVKSGQKERGEALKTALRERAIEEMFKAGWRVVEEGTEGTIYAKKDTL
jgi:hypothetical protein